MMHQYTILAISCGVFLALFSTTTASTVPIIYCQPGGMADSHPKVRQLCFALMERVDNQQEEGDILHTQLFPRASKRQDVDHVFLRFG